MLVVDSVDVSKLVLGAVGVGEVLSLDPENIADVEAVS
jgi:hypothetical protein